MYPFTERLIKNGVILREFNREVNSDELVWHQDKADRWVKVAKSGGWMLQMDNQLPKPLEEGKTYFIPAMTYHRVIKGNDNLVVLIKEKIEPDGDGPLGKYVFPSEKIPREPDDIGTRHTIEPNTDLEDKLEALVIAHFQDKNKPLPRSATAAILKMIQDNNYPDIFRLHNRGKVYRGMVLSKEIFQKLFGDLPKESKWYTAPINWIAGKSVKTNVDLPFSPTSKPSYSPGMDTHAGSFVSSWASSFKAAKIFAVNEANAQGGIPIVLAADAASNTYIDADPIYKEFEFARGYWREAEKIGVGDINLESITVYKPMNIGDENTTSSNGWV